MLHSHWVSPDSPVDPGWPLGNAHPAGRGPGQLCREKSSVDLGPSQALSTVSFSMEAGASLEGLGFLCHSLQNLSPH